MFNIPENIPNLMGKKCDFTLFFYHLNKLVRMMIRNKEQKVTL